MADALKCSGCGGLFPVADFIRENDAGSYQVIYCYDCQRLEARAEGSRKKADRDRAEIEATKRKNADYLKRIKGSLKK